MAKKASKKSTTKTARRKATSPATKRAARSPAKPKEVKKTKKKAATPKTKRTAKAVGTTKATRKATTAKATAKRATATRGKAKTTKTVKTVKKTGGNGRVGGANSRALVRAATAGDGVAKRKPPKRPLSRKDLETFRAMLLEKRAELVGDVHTLRDEALKGSRQELAGDLSTMPIHMAELGTDNYELEFTLGLIEGGRAVLQEIDEALERIHDGTYGVCLATGSPIGKARLRAKPWAKYCYEYVMAQETGKRP